MQDRHVDGGTRIQFHRFLKNNSISKRIVLSVKRSVNHSGLWQDFGQEAEVGSKGVRGRFGTEHEGSSAVYKLTLCPHLILLSYTPFLLITFREICS